MDLLEVKPHFKAFRIASVKTAAASANASAKALPPRASAVFFLIRFAISLPRPQRDLPRSMWEQNLGGFEVGYDLHFPVGARRNSRKLGHQKARV